MNPLQKWMQDGYNWQKNSKGNIFEQEEANDLRSDGGEGPSCGPCAQYSWETSCYATFCPSDVNHLLSTQLDIRTPVRKGNLSHNNPMSSDPYQPQKVEIDTALSFEHTLGALWTIIEKDAQTKRDVLSYYLTPRNERTHISDLPMFLLAVCIILRASAMGHQVCIVLDPRWMGVPGTQYGLRCHLRYLIGKCEQVSSQDIIRLYREVLLHVMALQS